MERNVEPKVAAVVVTYNRIKLLGQCLEHLLAQTCPCDVFVVNNASTDGTAEWLDGYCAGHENVQALTLAENTGGAGGFNRGMRWAAESGYGYVWVMDDDCLPRPDALEKLMEADVILKSDGYGWLASVPLWTDGRECKMNRPKLSRQYFQHIELLRYGIVQAEQATFVSILFPVNTIRQVGLPIKEFFIWGDDIEYTRRIAVRNKLPCYLVGQSQVIHAMQDNNGSNIATSDAGRISRYHYAFRNENYLYRQEGFKGFCYYFAKRGRDLLQIMAHAQDHRLRRCWVVLRELIGGLWFNPKVEYATAEEQRDDD